MRKVVGYGRVSTTSQMDGTSPEEQKKSIKDECDRNGYELVNFYSDFAISGKDDKRPGLQKMLADAKAQKFQTVMFTKLDRLGRNLRDIKNILFNITDAGLTFSCIQQPEINNEGIYGDLLLNILGAFAEFEWLMIRDRTTRGRMIKWREGNGAIGSLPVGYTRANGKIEVDKEKAKIYNQIVSMYLDQNYTMRDIAIKLQEQSLSYSSKKPAKWSNVTISKILKNTAYVGEQIQNKIGKPEEEWITIKYPPLITRERFDQIQARIENQKQKPKKHHTGLYNHFMAENVLFCGYCGARLKKRNTYKDNFSYCCFWYRAGEKNYKESNHQQCILKPIDADSVDNDIYDEVVKMLSQPSQFAKSWLRNIDIEAMKKSIEIMKKRKETLKITLHKCFNHLTNTRDSELQKIYESDIKKNEDAFKTNQKNLKEAEANLSFAQNKFDRLTEFEKAIKGGKAKQIRTLSRTKAGIQQYLYGLSFAEKKRIMEAVINPANGGKVLLRFGTKQEDCEGEVVLDMNFDMDIDRNESLINSLNKNELLIKGGYYGISRCSQRKKKYS